MSPSSTMDALKREVIEKRPDRFKIPMLKGVANVFENNHPFVAAFGNRFTDALSYRAVSIPNERIFIIDHKGGLKKDMGKENEGVVLFQKYKEIDSKFDKYFSKLN